MTFHKPQRCENGGISCVEVDTDTPGTVQVRDSKNLIQKPLTFDATEWRAFIASVKAGQYDI